MKVNISGTYRSSALLYQRQIHVLMPSMPSFLAGLLGLADHFHRWSSGRSPSSRDGMASLQYLRSWNGWLLFGYNDVLSTNVFHFA